MHESDLNTRGIGEIGRTTTPVTVISGQVVVGYDVPKLRSLLQLNWRHPCVHTNARPEQFK
jgi:hypothetical protein